MQMSGRLELDLLNNLLAFGSFCVSYGGTKPSSSSCWKVILEQDATTTILGHRNCVPKILGVKGCILHQISKYYALVFNQMAQLYMHGFHIIPEKVQSLDFCNNHLHLFPPSNLILKLHEQFLLVHDNRTALISYFSIETSQSQWYLLWKHTNEILVDLKWIYCICSLMYLV